jgi:hypothetical protein
MTIRPRWHTKSRNAVDALHCTTTQRGTLMTAKHSTEGVLRLTPPSGRVPPAVF